MSREEKRELGEKRRGGKGRAETKEKTGKWKKRESREERGGQKREEKWRGEERRAEEANPSLLV